MYDVSVCVSMSQLAPAGLLQGPVKTPPATPHDLSLPAAPRDMQTVDHDTDINIRTHTRVTAVVTSSSGLSRNVIV